MDETKKIHLPNKVSKERNKRVLESCYWDNKEVREMRESLRAGCGIDMKDEKSFPVMKENFSWAKAKAKLRETGSSTTFPQLLRAGVQTAVNNMVHLVDTTYSDWAHVIPSKMNTELYAPLHGLSFLSEVGAQEKYPESNALGLSIQLTNKKYGQMFPVEKELLNDDQTGQFQNMVSLMAEYAEIGKEVLVYAKLSGAVGTYPANGPLKIAASETKPSYESTWPYAASPGLSGGGINRNSPFLAFNFANLQTSRTAMRKMLNLQGLKMQVKPKRVILSPFYELDAATILNSNYYPAGAQAAGVTGGAFAENFLKGIAQLTVADYLFDNTGVITGTSKAWYLADDKPAFVLQIRQPALVEMENPESGESFDRDVVRHKLSYRANADFIDPRFFFQGSDGSV